MELQIRLSIFSIKKNPHLNKEIVSSRDGFHDMSLDLLILQDGHPGVYQDWRRSGIEVGAEVWRRLQHVDSRDLESNGLQLGQ